MSINKKSSTCCWSWLTSSWCSVLSAFCAPTRSQVSHTNHVTAPTIHTISRHWWIMMQARGVVIHGPRDHVSANLFRLPVQAGARPLILSFYVQSSRRRGDAATFPSVLDSPVNCSLSLSLVAVSYETAQTPRRNEWKNSCNQYTTSIVVYR